MNKSQKIKNAARKTRKANIKYTLKNVLLYPWNLLCKVSNKIWKWLKSIDIVGMINLTLLVAIIVLLSSLIFDFTCCRKCDKKVQANKNNVVTVVKTNNNNKAINNKNVVNNNKVNKKSVANQNRKVIKRKFNVALPIRKDQETNLKPQIKVVGVKKPVIVKELSFPANELPKQNLSGDIIVDTFKDAAVLSNGVNINGNLFIQNMRKYTLPCGAVINGNLFIRNVERMRFCGEFTVTGNIYVNRQSSFGPIPSNARVKGQVIL